MSLAAAESRVAAAVDLDALLEDLDALVRIRSVGGREDEAQRAMAGRLEALGMEVDLWEIDLDELRRHPAFSEEVARDSALGAVGCLRGTGSGPSLMLNGHVDVVDAGAPDAWSVPPWELTVRDGMAWGRGSVDMKGGLACALAAVRALRAAGVRLAGDLSIASVVGEEDGGTGTLATLERGWRADGAVVMEPTRLAIAPAHVGAVNFRIELRGRAAHACVRTEGVSAIGLLPTLLTALEELERRRNARLRRPPFEGHELPFALSVGRVRGGDWPATVAESVEFDGRYGIAPGERIADARREFEEAVAEAAAAHEWLSREAPRVSWWGGRFEPAAIDPSAPIVGAVQGAFADVAQRPAAVEGMTFGADMRLLVNEAGIDTVMFGPGDVRAAHRADEHVPLADLEAVARTLAVTAMRFCGVSAV